jgi:SAM-dependent methyltransferase
MQDRRIDAKDPPNRGHEVENVVKDFYETYGWVKADARSGEDTLFREFPEYYYRFYEKNTLRRTLSCFDGVNGKVLIAGCGDMPDNHIAIARRFSEISCIDISERALAATAEKIGDEATYTHGSILHAPFPENAFDAVLCAHVLYHVDANEQARAVDEMIRVAKPGGRVVIVYSNPDSIFAREFWRRSWLGRLVARRRGRGQPPTGKPPLYFACHSLAWWRRFEPRCAVRFLPWDIMGSQQARLLLRGRMAPILVYRAAAWLERVAPAVAVRLWQYPIVVMEKKAADR